MEPEVPSVRGAQRIACGMNHACVLGVDAKVYCWGNNAYGALGDGTEKNRVEPGPVVGLSQVAEIAVDYARTCARSISGDVHCWGDSEFGKAGDGRLPDNVGREKTTPGRPILAGAASLGVGTAHACATMSDGRVSCWGQNNSGSCGFPKTTRYVPRPRFVPKLKDVATIRAGESLTCSLDRQGAVACWGTGSTGVLGPSGPQGDYASSHTPVPIPLPAGAVEVAIGASRHACARLTNGAIHCWGQNDHGQLGDGTTTDKATPVQVKGLPGPATALSLGLDRSCALTDGRVFCWGSGVTRRDESSFPDDYGEPVEVLVEGSFRRK
jgi:alpha-tubulin suppressor-like RCC1 family protein